MDVSCIEHSKIAILKITTTTTTTTTTSGSSTSSSSSSRTNTITVTHPAWIFQTAVFPWTAVFTNGIVVQFLTKSFVLLFMLQWQGYVLDDRGIVVRILGRSIQFYSSPNLQAGSGDHSASCTFGTECSLRDGKATGSWSWPLTSI
jgi:hypothetical protein